MEHSQTASWEIRRAIAVDAGTRLPAQTCFQLISGPRLRDANALARLITYDPASSIRNKSQTYRLTRAKGRAKELRSQGCKGTGRKITLD